MCNKQQLDIIASLIKTTHLINHSQNDKNKNRKNKIRPIGGARNLFCLTPHDVCERICI